MVFSGHTGTAAHRVDRGMHGNRVDSSLTTMHDNATDPVRRVQVDTRTNSLTSWTPHGPRRSYPRYTVRVSGQAWVR